MADCNNAMVNNLSLKVGGVSRTGTLRFMDILHEDDNFARLLSHILMLIYNMPGYEIL